ncbi:MAG: trypsin-like serine protease [Alphaproteobacteria bacterium]|nr:trypsin-like serine protease [Alphaproteobacteria bacterium]
MKYLKFFQYTLLSASIFIMGVTPSGAMDTDEPHHSATISNKIKELRQKDDPVSQHQLGVIYHGWWADFKKDPNYDYYIDWAKAKKAYKKSESYVRSRVNLGWIYENQGKIGLRAKPEKAKELYEHAANKGDSRGAFYLAEMYRDGNGVRKNPELAIQWYGKVDPSNKYFSAAQKELEKLSSIQISVSPHQINPISRIVSDQDYTEEKFQFEEEVIYPSIFIPAMKPSERRPQRVFHSELDDTAVYVPRHLQGREERILDPLDKRRKKIDNIEWPYSAHGRISMAFKLGNCWGSGTLVGPNLVLTAGHNIRMIRPDKGIIDEDTDINSIRFFPGANGSALTFGEVKVIRTFLSPRYTMSNPDYDNHDYALLVLDTPVGYQTGWFGIGMFNDADHLTRIHINVTGYPGDKCKINDHQMWSMKNKVLSVQDETFHYDIDTYDGQSGSGSWYNPDEENYYVIGIHTHGGNIDEPYNISNRLSLTKYNQIHEWIKSIILGNPLRIVPNISKWIEGIEKGGLTYEND